MFSIESLGSTLGNILSTGRRYLTPLVVYNAGMETPKKRKKKERYCLGKCNAPTMHWEDKLEDGEIQVICHVCGRHGKAII